MAYSLEVMCLGRLFGTDGVRGVANRELTGPLAYSLGRAVAGLLADRAGKNGAGQERPAIAIGRDTRISGDLLEAALVAGVTSAGVDALLLGVLPTPGVAYLTRTLGVQAGAVISASHNPVEDNGIKFFSADGFKLPDAVEDEIEHLVRNPEAAAMPTPIGAGVGRLRRLPDAAERYLAFLKDRAGVDLTGLRIVVDCANGAAYHVAPRLLSELGADVRAICAAPDGVNINAGCGSTHLQRLQQAVREAGADVGLAHDGDADRVLAVDERGAEVDGDQILAICALLLLQTGRLPHKAIAATLYSNLGLHRCLEAAGGRVRVTKAGDRYVLEAMQQEGIVLGGEQSGHIIFLEDTTTGDGLLTALRLLGVMRKTGKALSALAGVMTRFPQVLRNVRVRDKEGVASDPRVLAAVTAAEARLAGRGRIFIRPSGTEPVVRVMVEGPERQEVEEEAAAVAAAIAAAFGP